MNRKDCIIKKDNRLIYSHIARLDLRAARILNIAASQIKRSDKTFKSYKININRITKGSKSIYNKVKDNDGYDVRLIDLLTNSLMSEIIKIEKEKGWIKFNFLSECELFKKEGYIKVKFSERMAEYLLNLNNGNFTQLDLEIVCNLKQHYYIRLYEIIKLNYDKNKFKNFVEFEIIELQNKIGADGSYSTWNKFSEKILKPAQKSLKKHSDLIFTFKAWAEHGRSFNKIRINFEINPDFVKENQTDVIELETITVIEPPLIHKKLTEKYDLLPFETLKCIEHMKNKHGDNWEVAIDLKLKEISILNSNGKIFSLKKYTVAALTGKDNQKYTEDLKAEVSKVKSAKFGIDSEGNKIIVKKGMKIFITSNKEKIYSVGAGGFIMNNEGQVIFTEWQIKDYLQKGDMQIIKSNSK